MPDLYVKDVDAGTALAIIDDWDESDRAKVNPIVGQAGIAAGAGAVGATTTRVTLASDDPLVAKSSSSVLVTVSMTTPTDAQDAGDVIADTQEVAGALRATGGRAELESVTLIDTDDQGIACTLVFLSTNTSLGTEDSAPDIDDTEALDLLGFVEIASGDYKDLGGARVATVRNVGLFLTGAATSVYVAVMTGGTPTYASGVITLKLGIRHLT